MPTQINVRNYKRRDIRDAVDLRDRMLQEILKGESVLVNFEGVNVGLPRFFEEAFGGLLGLIDLKDLDDRVRIVGAQDSDRAMLHNAISEATKAKERSRGHA